MSVVGAFVSPSCLCCGQLQNNWWDTIWLSLIFTSCRCNQQDHCKAPLPSMQQCWNANAAMHGCVMGDWKHALAFRGVQDLRYVIFVQVKPSGVGCTWWRNCWCSAAVASLGLAFLSAGELGLLLLTQRHRELPFYKLLPVQMCLDPKCTVRTCHVTPHGSQQDNGQLMPILTR